MFWKPLQAGERSLACRGLRITAGRPRRAEHRWFEEAPFSEQRNLCGAGGGGEGRQPPHPFFYSSGEEAGMNLGLTACDVAQDERGIAAEPSTVLTWPGSLRGNM